MDTIKLEGTLPSGKKCWVWVCGKCGNAARTEQEAIDCCKPWLCACGKPAKYYGGICEDCSNQARRKQEQDTHDKAKKVKWKDYDGTWLFCERDGEYYQDLDSLLDAFNGENLPTWAYATYAQKFSMDAEDIVRSAIENSEWFEDAIEWLLDLTVLQKELDTVSNQIPDVYLVDESIVVEFEEEAEEQTVKNANEEF